MFFDKRGQSKIAIVQNNIDNIQAAIDVMGNAAYNGCDKVLIYKENLPEKFFDLKTRLAGEMLQKFVNYKMRVAIVGDFSIYKSKSLRDFIYECNNGNNIFFKDTLEDGLNTLHSK
ncbi:DUF4180 domain-containing protein [Clostridiaceae bacterium M8S5]|nr:DUF4180 domain-containing protein [Clostridiaceae bacterium M8S5]